MKSILYKNASFDGAHLVYTLGVLFNSVVVIPNDIECSASCLPEALNDPIVLQTEITRTIIPIFPRGISKYPAMVIVLPQCFTCRKGFSTTSARDQHCRDTCHHWPWNECDKYFSWFYRFWELKKNWKRLNHYDHECTYCDETFLTPEKQQDHEWKQQFYCGDCNRTFQAPNNLQMISFSSFGADR